MYIYCVIVSSFFFHLCVHLALSHNSSNRTMGSRYLKSENETLRRLYPSATKAEIMAELPDRNWVAVSKYARHKLGLYRTRKSKGLQMLAGRLEAKKKR
jgi:hypothetical protein